MSSSLLTKEEESVCVVRQRSRSSHLVYKLERIEEYDFQFYGVRHRLCSPIIIDYIKGFVFVLHYYSHPG